MVRSPCVAICILATGLIDRDELQPMIARWKQLALDKVEEAAKLKDESDKAARATSSSLGHSGQHSKEGHASPENSHGHASGSSGSSSSSMPASHNGSNKNLLNGATSSRASTSRTLKRSGSLKTMKIGGMYIFTSLLKLMGNSRSNQKSMRVMPIPLADTPLGQPPQEGG